MLRSSLRLLLPALILLSRTCVQAEERLLVERLAVAPVSEIYIQLLLTNESASARTVRYSAKITGTLHAGSDRTDSIQLSCVDARSVADPEGVPHDFESSVQAGGFERVRYKLTLPPGYLGPVVLDIPEHSAEPVMFSVQMGAPRHMPAKVLAHVEPAKLTAAPASSSVDSSAAVAGTVGHGDPTPKPDPYATGAREAVLRRASQVLPGVSAYEPVYFGLGLTGGVNAKFQLSLKYNPIDVLPLYAGFTQTSIWDLQGDSKPFKDSAYRPSLFLLKDRFWIIGDKALVLGLQAGFEHESNGKGGLDSRSINILFFRPRSTWILHRSLGEDKDKVLRLVVSPKVYGYIEKSENPDIAEFRGYMDFYLALLYNDWKLSTTLRKGTRSNYGSVQVDAVFPMRESERLFARFGVHGVNGYWFAQYFNGWGESIIDYRTKQKSQFRLGVMVVP